MSGPRQPSTVVDRVVRWATNEPTVRAVLLTSSQTIPDAPLDVLSDYDLVLVVSDLAHFAHDDRWLQVYGRPMVRLPTADSEAPDQAFSRCVLYTDGTKIDWSVEPVAWLRRVIQSGTLPPDLDAGYRVVLDKDGLTATLPPPSYRAYIPRPPTEAEYHDLLEEFWWETTYVAKNLWRDELMFARYNLDYVIKITLVRRLLEWSVEVEHNWTLKTGVLGRGLKRRLDPQLWRAYAATYVGPDLEENWQALFATTELVRRVGVEVGTALGYAYPYELDRRVLAYLQKIRMLPGGAGNPNAG